MFGFNNRELWHCLKSIMIQCIYFYNRLWAHSFLLFFYICLAAVVCVVCWVEVNLHFYLTSKNLDTIIFCQGRVHVVNGCCFNIFKKLTVQQLLYNHGAHNIEAESICQLSPLWYADCTYFVFNWMVSLKQNLSHFNIT